MPLSEGEIAYRDAFQFILIRNVPQGLQLKLKDLLYKYSHNLSEAYEYLEILEYVNDMDRENKNELVYRIHGMSLQCFALSVRKLTDNSNRSAKVLINTVIKPELREAETAAINEIYKHFDKFLNKFVVHQDTWSIQEALQSFPDNDTIEADLKHLNDLYDTVVNDLCSDYIRVHRESKGYGPMLDKLI